MIKGYKIIDYDTLQGILFDAYRSSKKTYFQIAQEIGVNSTQTPVNAIKAKEQIVTDQKLIKIANAIGVDLNILHDTFGHHYYIKNK